MRAAWVAVLLGVLSAGPVAAEEMVLSLSKARIDITSSFTGEPVVLFGVIEAPGTPLPHYDVVVTVRGPAQPFTTWRKERVLGLWVNVDRRAFVEAPSYLAVLSSRPTPEMAEVDTLRQEQIGLRENRLLQRLGSDYADVVQNDPFRQAFLRVKQAQGLYYENTEGVSFLNPLVFRATIPIPGTAPVGRYEVVVKLLADGTVLRRGTVALDVGRTDFEQAVATAAREHAWLYGLGTALLALAVGLLGNLAFRRD
ncbi:MAG TPA: TIGR02186 family protein [Xanthobacteraceae bacterium]|nr:TIGR02186 family protein [Xanthobacteraceae bacterium]